MELGLTAEEEKKLQEKSEQIKDSREKDKNFFRSNLGRVRLKNEMVPVPISRTNLFQNEFGDVRQNVFAFMLEELDDDVNTLLARLFEIDRNLQIEIDKLSKMIGDIGPRESTKNQAKYAQIASRLVSNFKLRVSETISARNSSSVSIAGLAYENPTEDSVDLSDILNGNQSRASNRQSKSLFPNLDLAKQLEDELRSMNVPDEAEVASDESDLLNSCEIFRQIKVESIKAEQKNVSETLLKEKQLRCFKRLEDLKIKLLRLIHDLQDSVTVAFNPFMGTNQLMRNSDGAPIYNSFVMNDEEEDDTEGRKRKQAKFKQTKKKRMAKLLQCAVY